VSIFAFNDGIIGSQDHIAAGYFMPMLRVVIMYSTVVVDHSISLFYQHRKATTTGPSGVIAECKESWRAQACRRGGSSRDVQCCRFF
jgi:hypothetical protein